MKEDINKVGDCSFNNIIIHNKTQCEDKSLVIIVMLQHVLEGVVIKGKARVIIMWFNKWFVFNYYIFVHDDGILSKLLLLML